MIIATFVRTGRIQSSDRISIFMRAEVATDLTRDTRVYLQGLEVGRLRDLVPAINPETQQLDFLARLDIDVAFDDGTPLMLPKNTVAEITKATPIAPPIVELSFPKVREDQATLTAGDTINSIRREEVLNVLSQVAGDLTQELFQTMEDVRTLLETSTNAIAEVQGHVASTTPRVDSILLRVSDNLAATETLLEDLTPRVGVIQDSVLATISSARGTIEGFDSLRVFVQNLAIENQMSIQEIIDQMTRTAIILGHFSDQVSRRPTRILTGVTPPPGADSIVDRR